MGKHFIDLSFKEGKFQKRKDDAAELATYIHRYQQLDNLTSSTIEPSLSNLQHCSNSKHTKTPEKQNSKPNKKPQNPKQTTEYHF